MPTIHEQVSRQFYRWERRLRGIDLWPDPVLPEPPFESFDGYVFPVTYVDDGRKPTLLSSFFHSVWGRTTVPLERELQFEQEPQPEFLERELSLLEVGITFPRRASPARIENCENFLSTLKYDAHSLAFEIIATGEAIHFQFVVAEVDVQIIAAQLHSHFPDLQVRIKRDFLKSLWNVASEHQSVVQFGVEREAMIPIGCRTAEPYVGLLGAFSSLQPTETAVFQVIFQPANRPWRESLLRLVTDLFKHPVFINAPELAKGAEEKTKKPLFAATVRLAINGETWDRVRSLSRAIGSALSAYNIPGANELVPLENSEYAFETHLEDFLGRLTRRCGILLNSEELASFVHLPGPSVHAPKLFGNQLLTRSAPPCAKDPAGVLLGHNEHAGEIVDVRLSSEQRVRNTYIIGTPGTGKSTLLLQFIRQDLERGDGIAVIDPHGDLIEAILGFLPESRVKDIILLDPSDERFCLGFNVLSAHSDVEKNLLASDLVSVFERLSTSWGDQMGIVLKKAIMAFLESPKGGTLVDLQRFLIEPDFRKEFLQTVNDPEITYYWTKAFPLLAGNRSVGPILTRLETFLSSKMLRRMVSERANDLNFPDILNTRKVFLAKLSQGLIGKENSFLLGSLLMSKFQQAAMGRQQIPEEKRQYFWIFADEFHDYITPSMAEILSGTRKYRIGMTLAHQEVRQLDRIPEVASAVRSAFCRICFRVTEQDAKSLENGFDSYVAADLQKLGTGEAICRVERSDYDFNLRILKPIPVVPSVAAQRHSEVFKFLESRYPRRQASPASGYPGQTTEIVPAVEIVPKPKEKAETATEPIVPEHQALKEKIANVAQGLGFRAEMEKVIPGTNDRIDVVLTKGDQTIACEISFTTPADHELHNVRKCLRASFKHIAVICEDRKRLTRLQKFVSAAFLAGESACVGFYTPEEFLKSLQGSESGGPIEPGGPTKRQINFSDGVSEAERKSREAKLLADLRENMRPKRNPPKG